MISRLKSTALATICPFLLFAGPDVSASEFESLYATVQPRDGHPSFRAGEVSANLRTNVGCHNMTMDMQYAYVFDRIEREYDRITDNWDSLAMNWLIYSNPSLWSLYESLTQDVSEYLNLATINCQSVRENASRARLRDREVATCQEEGGGADDCQTADGIDGSVWEDYLDYLRALVENQSTVSGSGSDAGPEVCSSDCDRNEPTTQVPPRTDDFGPSPDRIALNGVILGAAEILPESEVLLQNLLKRRYLKPDRSEPRPEQAENRVMSMDEVLRIYRDHFRRAYVSLTAHERTPSIEEVEGTNAFLVFSVRSSVSVPSQTRLNRLQAIYTSNNHEWRQRIDLLATRDAVALIEYTLREGALALYAAESDHSDVLEEEDLAGFRLDIQFLQQELELHRHSMEQLQWNLTFDQGL